MGHFRKNEQKKVGHFEKKARDRFENEKRTENEYVRFWGISGKIAYALTCKIPPSKAFWGISRYLPHKPLKSDNQLQDQQIIENFTKASANWSF